ncbi:GDSL esterase/lipase [Hordeum vulgare]|nr:GDSL esterase/lipase [Hordeum vulgare]
MAQRAAGAFLRRSLGLAPPTAPRALSTSVASAEGEAAVAAKAKRSKKKNLFDVVQFLPYWGVGYKVAKTTWRDVSYQFTKINLYKDGRHRKVWGIRHKALGQPLQLQEFYANSLFVIGEFGGNDYNAPLFAGKGLMEAYKFRPDVIQGISDGVEELIAEGAVDLIVPGVMPTRCFPVYLNMLDMPAHEYGARSGCIRQYNTFSWVHNAHLKKALEKL